MICIGYSDDDKRTIIAQYCEQHSIVKTVVISADEFLLAIPDSDQVRYSDVIMYVTFYRLLQEITPQTLVVLNECLRTQNRYDLSYNCIRNFLNLTGHQLIFQQLPLIDTREDFMILFDFDTRSRWKRRPFDAELIRQESQVTVHPLALQFSVIEVPTTEETHQKYAVERQRLFTTLGNKDPHTLPRNLYMVGTLDKLAYIDAQESPLLGTSQRYVARNQRLRRTSVVPYSQVQAGIPYTIVDLPHRLINFCDFIRCTGQTEHKVLVVGLKVDHWYYSRYVEWSERIHDCYTSLS